MRKELLKIYDEVRGFNQGLAIVRKGKLFGVVNKQGTLVFPVEYDIIYNFNLDYAVAMKNMKFGVLNILGGVVFPCEYDSVSMKSRSRKIWLEQNGEYVEHQLPKLTITK